MSTWTGIGPQKRLTHFLAIPVWLLSSVAVKLRFGCFGKIELVSSDSSGGRSSISTGSRKLIVQPNSSWNAPKYYMLSNSFCRSSKSLRRVCLNDRVISSKRAICDVVARNSSFSKRPNNNERDKMS